jgi:hypothetical protein
MGPAESIISERDRLGGGFDVDHASPRCLARLGILPSEDIDTVAQVVDRRRRTFDLSAVEPALFVAEILKLATQICVSLLFH